MFMLVIVFAIGYNIPVSFLVFEASTETKCIFLIFRLLLLIAIRM